MDGKVVKGRNFLGLQYAGKATELAERYYEQGADELVMLDISATNERRKTALEVVRQIKKELFIPLTVGGGIKSVEQIKELLASGADKVSLNSAAVKDPKLIEAVSDEFGRQCIVVSIDSKKINGSDFVFTNSAARETALLTTDWARRAEKYGAGEILLTSIDADGTNKGFDVEITAKVSEAARIPVIASGGAGSKEDFYKALVDGKADAVLAASVFHYRKIGLQELKEYLREKGVEVR